MIILDMIVGNDNDETPSEEELLGWAEEHGAKFPILAEDGQVVSNYVSGSYGLPYKVLLDRGVVVEMVGDATDSDVAELLGD